MHGGAVAIDRAPVLAWRADGKAGQRGWFALAVAVLLHALLLASALRDRAPAPPDSPRRAIAWLDIAAPATRPVLRPPPPPLPLPPAPRLPRAAATRASPMVAAPAERGQAPPAAEPEPPRASAAQILSLAKRDVGQIDKDLRKEGGVKNELSLSADGPLQRLARGIEQAHDAAPNKWYQAARIEDITPPGDDARKIYRITSPLAGTYCVRYPDKNKIGRQSGAANLGEPLIGACPRMF